MTYLVIGVCLLLLVIVIVLSAKPISMGIEARRNMKYSKNQKDKESSSENINDTSVSEELIKIKELYETGVITKEEFLKAKDKILN